MKAQLIIKDRIRKGSVLIERVVWVVPTPVDGCSHHFKYRLYCGLNGVTVVRYDNEPGKGYHRHIGKGEREESYALTILEQLVIRF